MIGYLVKVYFLKKEELHSPSSPFNLNLNYEKI